MHKRAVFWAIGKLLQIMALALLAPLGIGLYDAFSGGTPMTLAAALELIEVGGFALSAAASFIIGTALVLACRKGRHQQGIIEGYAIVTLGWLALSAVAAIPLAWYFVEELGHGLLIAYTDGFFEVMSGFTTTGATILTDIEVVPRSLLFHRALTHWLGGMGIITLAIVVFPSLGVSGYQMFRGEVPGPTKDRLQPKLAQTASILWGVYVLLTGAEIVLLWAAGMDWFDSICHTFATMATGGFSTKNASVAGFQSDLIEWIIILFMYFAGVNFVLHFRALRGDLKTMLRNREFVFYNVVIVATILIITAGLFIFGLGDESQVAASYRYSEPTADEIHQQYISQESKIDGLYDSFRAATFQTLAIVTTTGFATADFDMWPNLIRFLLVLLMFFGGCAGSTGGGMKMIRVMIVGKVALNVLKKLVQPRLVSPVKIGKRPVDDQVIVNVVSFFILFIGLFILVAALMTMFVPDLTTAVTVSIATIGNIGPGLAGVGAVENYGWIPIGGKWLLIFSMLLGRLEIFTVLIVLRPSVWRK
jgi:trk system potassium uptake protein TrkH